MVARKEEKYFSRIPTNFSEEGIVQMEHFIAQWKMLRSLQGEVMWPGERAIILTSFYLYFLIIDNFIVIQCNLLDFIP